MEAGMIEEINRTVDKLGDLLDNDNFKDFDEFINYVKNSYHAEEVFKTYYLNFGKFVLGINSKGISKIDENTMKHIKTIIEKQNENFERCMTAIEERKEIEKWYDLFKNDEKA